MSTLSVTLSRSAALGGTPLDISAGLYRITPDGVGSPDIGWRRAYAADSSYTHGSELIAAVKEQTTLPLGVLVLASSSAALDDACEDLYDALSQFSYTCTVTVDGIPRVWSCDPADWTRGPITHGAQAVFVCRVGITIPVYPIPGV